MQVLIKYTGEVVIDVPARSEQEARYLAESEVLAALSTPETWAMEACRVARSKAEVGELIVERKPEGTHVHGRNQA